MNEYECDQPNQEGENGYTAPQPPQQPQPPYPPPYGVQPPYGGQTPPPYPPPPYGQPPYQPYGNYPPPKPTKMRVASNPENVKLFNILSYFSFLWIVGLIADGRNPSAIISTRGLSFLFLRWYWGW